MFAKFKLSLLSQLKKYINVSKIMRKMAFLSRKLTEKIHRMQYLVEWSVDNPEHFDHYMDLHFQWKKTRHSFPMERGVFSSYALKGMHENNKGLTLDLCCGDGFYTYYFYSLNSVKVIGMDFDPLAIWSAKKYNKADNVEFILGDIRKDIPSGPFDNVIWDAAIEHFTADEIVQIMQNIKKSLTKEGILSGYTIQEKKHGKHLHQHEYEFHDKEDLSNFLKPYFKNIQILQTNFSQRINYYFFASDGELPFSNQKIFNISSS